MTAAICGLCPHHCRLQPGQTGLCRGRMNEGGKILCKNYGAVTSLALDPIEKKPLARFHPGSFILSVGSYGCNLRCPFCQNYEIAQAGAESVGIRHMEPEELAGWPWNWPRSRGAIWGWLSRITSRLSAMNTFWTRPGWSRQRGFQWCW